MTEAQLVSHMAQLEKYGFSNSTQLLSELMLSSTTLSLSTRLSTLCQYADSLFANREYTRAQGYYNQALVTARKLKTLPDGLSLHDIKFKIHNCYCELGEHKQALQILDSVPAGSRTIEMNMALGHLWKMFKNRSRAVSALMSVIRKCPLALDAVRSLIELGENVDIIFAPATGLDKTIVAWLRLWVQGHQYAERKDYRAATKSFVSLQRILPDNPYILVNIAEWQWKQGCLPAGKLAFEQARAADPNLLDKMDIFAHVLVAQGKEADLNQLCSSLMAIDKSRVETWLSLARYYQLLCENNPDEMTATKYAKKGLLFVEKASAFAKDHVELHMVKGTLLLALDDPVSAATEFRTAYSHTKDFPAYQGLVSCYIAENKLHEALEIAKEGQQQMPANPRAITLLGVVLKRYIGGNPKARKLFNKALSISNDCMDSVFALFELELEEKNYEDAIKLLSGHLNHSRADYVHRRLADAYLLNGQIDVAIKHYQLALSVNPDYEPAKQGIAQATKELDSNGAEEDEEEQEEVDLDASINEPMSPDGEIP